MRISDWSSDVCSSDLDDQAQCRRGQHAREHGEFRIEAPDLGGVRRDVACHAEESGMAEGKQAAVAEQKIEGTGKHRNVQDLHEEYRIEAKRLHEEQHAKPGEERHRVTEDALPSNKQA